MDFETFISLTIYMSITASTPGPNNILALNSVINYERKEAVSIIAGIFIGFAIIMILCALCCATLIEILPAALTPLKILGVLYVLYLAYKVARSLPPKLQHTQTNVQKLNFLRSFVLQFVNVKIILYGITIHVAFVLPYYQDFIWLSIFTCYSILIGFLGIFLWIIAGVALKNFLQKHYKVANAIMALFLVGSGLQILLS